MRLQTAQDIVNKLARMGIDSCVGIEIQRPGLGSKVSLVSVVILKNGRPVRRCISVFTLIPIWDPLNPKLFDTARLCGLTGIYGEETPGSL